MRLPSQETKPKDDRKRRRRVGGTNNNQTIGDIKDGVADELTMARQEKVASFSHHKRVADYLLGRSIGEGSFAKVRLGLHVQTAEEVAVKVISKARARKDAYVHKNLRREGRILQMARHKNIVQVYDILETDNNYYLVTEFCRGGELIDIVTDKGCLPENDVRRYISQLVSAVGNLHDHGIVHRDLKVENLLLDDEGEVKIIDFGLSNVISSTGSDPSKALVTQCGSPAYAAPELLAKNMYGPKVDVWSIGVITYALLVGKLPFTVEPFRIPKLCRKMLLGDMNPIPSHLSGNCRHFIRRLLVPDPDMRPGIGQVSKLAWISSIGKPSKMSPYGKSKGDEVYATTDIDTDVVREMTSKLDFEFSNVLNCVRKNRPGEALATYYLLLKQKLHLKESIDRRHNDVIGSDGNLDHENESDKSSDEEGLNDIDDVTNAVIFNGKFKKRELHKGIGTQAAKRNNGPQEETRESPISNKVVVDNLIQKHVTEEVMSPTDPDSSLIHHENNFPKSAISPVKENVTDTEATQNSKNKLNSRQSKDDIDRTMERLENNQRRFNYGLKQQELAAHDVQRTEETKMMKREENKAEECSKSKLPELGGKSEKLERKSRGPNSMRDLMKTMSRARDALQRRNIFGQGKNKLEEKRNSGSPELNKFRRLLSRNSYDSNVTPSDRMQSCSLKSGERQNDEKVWTNYAVSDGTHPVKIKLPGASPPATPLILSAKASIPNSPLPPNDYYTTPRLSRGSTFYSGRPSLPQRIPSFYNSSNYDRVTQERHNGRFPRLSTDKDDEVTGNPLWYANLTPRYRFPSPPRTPSFRETSISGTTSGVREIIEKFHALMSNGEQPKRFPNARVSVRASESSRNQNSTAGPYLPSQRNKREEIRNKTPVPNGAQALRLTPNGGSPYSVQRHAARTNGHVKQNDAPFASHFGREKEAVVDERQQRSPLRNTGERNPSKGVWYKSVV